MNNFVAVAVCVLLLAFTNSQGNNLFLFKHDVCSLNLRICVIRIEEASHFAAQITKLKFKN